MPYNRRGSSRKMRLVVIDSIKNVRDFTASTGNTIQTIDLAKAKDTPVTTVNSDVKRGCIIKAVYLSFDVCGLAASGVLQRTLLFLIKNPGANLTPPSPLAVGTSNEKKFIFRQWQFMTMRNQEGNNPNHWEGWIKIPRRYQRMGTDDLLSLSFITSTAAGHLSGQAIYKWYS